MKIGIPKEIQSGERRVAATPRTTVRLKKVGFEVLIEAGAGSAASFFDAEYEKAGASIIPDARTIWQTADLVLKIGPPTSDEVEQLPENGKLISFIQPGMNKPLIEQLKARRITSLAIECIPRITRAQKMDVLSSMANIAGYRAVIESANEFGRFFTGQITAAGKVPPAKVLVIGAGVAGLAAIGCARGLGAIVRAFDVRSVVREEVQSMGAEFLEVALSEEGAGSGGYAKEMSEEFIEAEMKLFEDQAREVDIIITTAQIPGKIPPMLLPRNIVEVMKPGSVIVDLAASDIGGNCELSEPNQVIVHNGIHIIGYTNLASRLPNQASELFGTNMVHFLNEMGGGESFSIDLDNEIIRDSMVTHEGEITWPPPKKEAPVPTKKPGAQPAEIRTAATAGSPAAGRNRNRSSTMSRTIGTILLFVLGGVVLGANVPVAMLDQLTVFALAIVIGWHVVWNVTPALHTPLMSVTNAISGIILLGGILQLKGTGVNMATILGSVAVLLAMINVTGGFLVTHRMLQMFRKE
jgi:NAD(P) transhydrogenase subunit alpha